MRLFYYLDRKVVKLTTLFLILFVISGCAGLGPKSISMGRSDYNEAINQTEDEQMLLSIVKGRYGETFSLLAVNGVAANVRFRTNIGVEAGIGPGENYDGNLVPLSGGMGYEENPTITYAPVQGEKYMRQLMSPIPLNLLVLIVRTGPYSNHYLTLVVNRINDMRNPSFLVSPAAKTDLRFKRFVELNIELNKAGVLEWVEDQREGIPFDILLTGYAPDYTEKVREYLTLLGLSMPRDESEDIVFPVYFAVKRQKLDGMAISTRSTFGVLEILRGAIEIPKEHADAGIAVNYPTPGLAGENLHIRSSEDKPEGASVAVKYRGYWFYIDETDIHTKLFYTTVRALWSVSMATSSDQNSAPVMTIPVS